jgi:type III restriction/modification enzyme restriction subunit
MARRATSAPADGRRDYFRLENRLVLVAWLNSLFGYEHNRDMLKDLAGVGEGLDSTGRSHVISRLLSRGGKCTLREAELARYDRNIRRHLAAMNHGRLEKITLRYFQYLATLYAEIYLDRLFGHPKRLLAELNRFVTERNGKRVADEPPDPTFSMDDLQKLAFWMATGSGKTLLMHLNYRQFLHYNTKPLDNVLLVTPNEGLTQQHLEQLAASGIPAERFDLQSSGLLSAQQHIVRVIEITKLVEEKKKGGGVSVPIEAFQGNNLIFVDEGHKGSGGEAWRGYREALGETGFTFEYSATFGQALNAAGNDDLTKEYAKAIGFDYSYRYFYGDGFGKDFNILNLRRTSSAEETDVLLLANLLSSYEQVRYFEAHGNELKPYNLAHPLWLFIGRKVEAIYTENGKKRSDVLTVVQFLHRFLQNAHGWSVRIIEKVLKGDSGLRMESGADLFANDLRTLKGSRTSGAAVFGDIVRRLFRADSPALLEMNSIRNADGELGLRVHGASAYFGLIYVGDAAALRDLVAEHAPDVEIGEEVIAGPLFPTVNRIGSDMQMMIGAKKFIEGWDSWRVSSMCLLNVGRSEGSEIIQLFGRGVRLKGLNGSLKRSTAILGREHPKNMRLLERLNIFAVRADYMAQFRDYLEREGVDTGGAIELELPLWNQTKYLNEGLYLPQWPKESMFLDEEVCVLGVDEKAAVRNDISTRVKTIIGSGGVILDGGAAAGSRRGFPMRAWGCWTGNGSIVSWWRIGSRRVIGIC